MRAGSGSTRRPVTPSASTSWSRVTNLHLYIEQPGRFNSADKGEVDEMGMVSFEQALLGTCSTVYQEMRVVVNSPLTVTIGEAPATSDAGLSTFNI